MRKHIYLYGFLILLFIAFNLFFPLQDPVMNDAANILFGSLLFLYMAWMAYLILKKIKRTRKG